MAHKTAKVVKRKGKPPLIKSPVGSSKRRPTVSKLKRKPKFAEKTHAEITRKNEPHKRTGDPAPPHPHVGRLKSKRIQDMIEASARRLPLNKKKSPPKPKRKPTVHKRYGGMSHVGLAPAEEARAGTMSEAKRTRYMQEGGYLKDIKPNTTWKQFNKKHPKAGITEEGFKRLKPPAGQEWKRKFRRTYGGLVPFEKEAKKGGQVKRRRYMKKGGTVYRKLGGKVTNGNDVVRMIYRGSS